VACPGCGAKRRHNKSQAKKAFSDFLLSDRRSTGGSGCCSGLGKWCAIEDCKQRVRRKWFSSSGVRFGYHECKVGHTMRIG